MSRPSSVNIISNKNSQDYAIMKTTFIIGDLINSLYSISGDNMIQLEAVPGPLLNLFICQPPSLEAADMMVIVPSVHHLPVLQVPLTFMSLHSLPFSSYLCNCKLKSLLSFHELQDASFRYSQYHILVNCLGMIFVDKHVYYLESFAQICRLRLGF